MKVFFYLTFIVFLCSCGTKTKNQTSFSNIPIQDSASNNKMDITVSDSLFVDSITIYKLLNSEKDSVNKILQVIDSSYEDDLSKDKIQLTLKWYNKNFDTNPNKELILHFHTDSPPLDIIYVLTKIRYDQYLISESI